MRGGRWRDVRAAAACVVVLPGFAAGRYSGLTSPAFAAEYPRAELQPDRDAPQGARGYVVIQGGPHSKPLRVLPERFSRVAPVLSPDGRLFAFDDFALASDDTRPECARVKCRKTKLVVADWSGRILLSTWRIMAPVWGSFCDAFDIVEWVDDHRVAIGCFGPSNYTYSIVHIPDGSIEQSHVSWLRTRFVWSPDRKHVAWSANLPHWPPNGSRSDHAAIDDDVVDERAKGVDLAVQSNSAITWSPDGQRIAWIIAAVSCPLAPYQSAAEGDGCELSDAGRYLAVAGLKAGYWLMQLPPACDKSDDASKPTWTNAVHIALRCAGNSPIDVHDHRFKDKVAG